MAAYSGERGEARHRQDMKTPRRSTYVCTAHQLSRVEKRNRGGERKGGGGACSGGRYYAHHEQEITALGGEKRCGAVAVSLALKGRKAGGCCKSGNIASSTDGVVVSLLKQQKQIYVVCSWGARGMGGRWGVLNVLGGDRA